MPAGACRAVLMAVAGLCLAVVSLVLSAPSMALADTPHAQHHRADAPEPTATPAPASAPSHGNACCTPAAACPLMHIGLPAAWPDVPSPTVRVAEPVPVAPALRGLDRPPPLPPPRPIV